MKERGPLWVKEALFKKKTSTSEALPTLFSKNLLSSRSYAQSQETCLLQAQSNVSLAKKTSFRIGGSARWFYTPKNLKELILCQQALQRKDVPVFILGNGSNLLVPDEGFDGLVVHLSSSFFKRIQAITKTSFRVGTGVSIPQLCHFAKQHCLSGFEALIGIPGSIGGALQMNAGVRGMTLADRLVQVSALNAQGKIMTLNKAQLSLYYRNIPELKNLLIYEAIFSGTFSSVTQIQAQEIAALTHRKNTQPQQASAGCIFKNPPGASAGQWIDTCGLKNTRCGDALISPIHGNFIVNLGQARCSDVLTLIQRIRTKIFQQHGVLLEPEILLLGKDWDEVLETP